jgi:hypothetical protein
MLSYLFICMSAFAGALLLALLSHWAHSEFMPYPDKLFDGGGLTDTVLNEVMSPEHRVFGHYDSVGWWEFYSWRNYAIHAGPYLFVVLATAILNWDNRAEAVAYICTSAAEIGLSPAFCP